MTALDAEVHLFGTQTPIYTMRAWDSTLGQYVFWFVAAIDRTGSQYTGPGPLTDIVVHAVKGT